jgi:MFS superfamily sulfate permease-like transporter
VDVHTQPTANVVQGLLILRPEEPLFFGSAERVTSAVFHAARARAGVHAVVLSLEESADLDSTAVECLLELDSALQRQNITLLLARAKTTVRELLQAWNPQGLGREDRLFWSVADAVERAATQSVVP